MNDTVDNLFQFAEELRGFSGAKQFGTGDELRDMVLGAVAVPLEKGLDEASHFAKGFELLKDSFKAIRHATQAEVPNLTFENIAPVYLSMTEGVVGDMSDIRAHIVEKGFDKSTRLVGSVEIQAANAYFAAIKNRNPLELLWNLRLDSLNALRNDGNYIESVLKIAIAAEMLIKHCCWMLRWESQECVLSSNGTCESHPADIFKAKPHSLIGKHLSVLLKGSWESSSLSKPVGMWRMQIAGLRNSVIHRGYEPTRSEAQGALDAFDSFYSFIKGKLNTEKVRFPKTCFILAASLPEIHEGGELKIQPSLGASVSDMAEYIKWLDRHLTPEFESE